jgi:hypothetical protein
MFETKHYVPILKWKRAEQKALESLSDKNREYITPLIQFVMPKPKSSTKETLEQTQEEKFDKVISVFSEKISEISEEILKFWGKDPIFIDFSLLYTTPLKVACFEKILTKGNDNGMVLIPVININDDLQIKNIVGSLTKKHNNGLCLRLVCSDFSDMGALHEKINAFLTSYNIEEKNIDLLVDIKSIEENDGKYQTYIIKSQQIPNLSKWRSFIFAGGAFPLDLSKCKLDEENYLPRHDWMGWIDHINTKKLQRNPIFADYTIQHPIYKESLQFFPPTTSIKYTLESNWLIMKGKKQKYELYLANAKLLSEDADLFMGENFSAGDKYIFDKGKHFEKYQLNPEIKGTGSTETWLTAGINHHLACTANQIANLP